MRTDNAPVITRREDYTKPSHLIDETHLDISLDPAKTVVKSRLEMRRGGDHGDGSAPLVLNGEALTLQRVAVDGRALGPGDYTLDDKTLTIPGLPERFTLEIENLCAPENNTALSGLYLSNGMFCTQCEAEGFRRITYYLDRPDVLSKFTVRVEGERASAPILLANGNLIEEGDADGERHFAVWQDPHPKPAYLFALVGGDLACVEDRFTTISGRDVTLRVFVQPENKDKCAYTLDALKRSMRWDEETFGREYDLDIFMIVAVDHFNFGAMENKGLNIFNSAYVLASPETATDQDYEIIESIVAHEYFHNWSGNRVTCRDWFQLCLKEGFTVFRDQEFSADMRSRPVQRIKDVRRLWAGQFPEDAGPLAHPPRPDSFITIDNFYTAAVYDKGAEVARMLKTLLGPEDFRAASDLYFDRHDGEAATVEDFVKAMEDASGKDLTQFREWYSSAGTPAITVTATETGVTLQQETKPTPGQSEKKPRHIPVRWASYDAATGDALDDGMLELRDAETTLPINAANGQRAVLSLLGGFSAPVHIKQDQTIEDRLVLARHDRDDFNRWAAINGLWRDIALAFAGQTELGMAPDKAVAPFIDALQAALTDDRLDPAFIAELLKAPTVPELAQGAAVIDPDALTAARSQLRDSVAAGLKPDLGVAYERLKINDPYSPDAAQAGKRTLRNVALGLLVSTGEGDLALAHAQSATNMTDEAAATASLAFVDCPQREEALERFYDKWSSDRLVINKWLAWKALSPTANALAEVNALLSHPAYDAGNPNKVRSVIGVFAGQNLAPFHAPDGRGYDFFVEQLLQIDTKNPQLAARLTTLLEQWRKLEPTRNALAKAALEKLAQPKAVSKNLYEIASRLLEG